MKDTPPRAFVPGVVVPAVLALFNLVAGKAIYPARRGLWAIYTDRYRVWGAILLEIAVAAGCFAWYVLANADEREHLALPIVTLSVVVALRSLVLAVMGFLG